MLGLLLARAGVQVTVLEKHGDFLRDFRGDTVHASTLTLLDELGLGEEFTALTAVRYIESLSVQLDAGEVPISDLHWLPGRHQHIALVPQWDFLGLVAEAGWAIGNVDTTVCCDRPRVGKHLPTMAANLAGALGVDPSQVRVSAKSLEGLGFPGRGEGIAALAVCLLAAT